MATSQTTVPIQKDQQNTTITPASFFYKPLPASLKARVPVVHSFRSYLRKWGWLPFDPLNNTTSSSTQAHGGPPLSRLRSVSTSSSHSTAKQRTSALDLDGLRMQDDRISREQLLDWITAMPESTSLPQTPPRSGQTTPAPSYHTTAFTPASETILHGRDASGFDWTFLEIGLQMLTGARKNAVHGYDTLAGTSNIDVQRNRGLLLDCITMVLRSLPTDLTMAEGDHLHASLADSTTAYEQDSLQISRRHNPRSPHAQSPNIIRSTVSVFLLQLTFLLAFLWPYIQYILQRCYRYERQHHITEMILARGLGATEALGDGALDVIDAGRRLASSRTGMAICGGASYVVEGVQGGISDAFSESLSIAAQNSLRQRQRQKLVRDKRLDQRDS